MSLRRRLLLVLLTLAAAGLIGTSVASTTLLKRSLVDQVDDKLEASLGFSRDSGRGVTKVEGSIVAKAPDENTIVEKGRTDGRDGRDGPSAYASDVFDLTGVTLVHGPPSTDDGDGPNLVGVDLAAVANRPFNRPANVGDGSYRVLVRPTIINGTPVLFSRALNLDDVNTTVRRFTMTAMIVGLGALLLLGLAAWLLVRASLRPLDRMTATAELVADGDLSARVDETNPSTEVGRLGTSLNTMMGRIEAAFAERSRTEDRLRRFVGDASHELRTPLTSIRGYAELVRSGVMSDPESSAVALGRIEAEAKRMGVLVEDLLFLARMDQGRPLEAAPVDFANIVGDAVRDAATIDADRTWNFERNGAVNMLGDANRLHQVVSNLLTNARMHTPAAVAVDVSVASEGDSAVLTVRDHGPGIPDEAIEQIFERFTRLDEGRARSDGGTGLGLSIVRSIVESHGGTVAAANSPDGGAVFTVRLPQLPPPATAPAP